MGEASPSWDLLSWNVSISELQLCLQEIQLLVKSETRKLLGQPNACFYSSRLDLSPLCPAGDLKDVAVEELQQQLRDMMFHLETQQQIEHLLPEARSEIQEGQINIAAGPAESCAGAGPPGARGRRGRGRKRK